ncbi:hypothetical protein ACFL02_06830 [Planctomycetota bacterium]
MATNNISKIEPSIDTVDYILRSFQAVEQILGRVLFHAQAIDEELQHAFQPVYPVNELLIRQNCLSLQWLIQVIAPGSNKLDITALSGYSVKPDTLLSIITCEGFLNRDLKRSARWLKELINKLEVKNPKQNIWKSKGRPSSDLVEGWHKATALLEKAVRKVSTEDLPRLAKIPGVPAEVKIELDKKRGYKTGVPVSLQNSLAFSDELARKYEVPLKQARVELSRAAQKDPFLRQELSDPSARGPKYVYDVAKAGPILENLKRRIETHRETRKKTSS